MSKPLTFADIEIKPGDPVHVVSTLEYDRVVPVPIPVVIESPYAGDVERNLRYLRACMRDSLLRGEAPYASHGLYTQPGVLDDTVPDERALGMAAGFVWRRHALASVFYMDLGESGGMACGRDDARELSKQSTNVHLIVDRYLGGEWSAKP